MAYRTKAEIVTHEEEKSSKISLIRSGKNAVESWTQRKFLFFSERITAVRLDNAVSYSDWCDIHTGQPLGKSGSAKAEYILKTLEALQE